MSLQDRERLSDLYLNGSAEFRAQMEEILVRGLGANDNPDFVAVYDARLPSLGNDHPIAQQPNQIDLEAQDADVADVAPPGDDEAAVPIVVQPPELAPGLELPVANAQPIGQQPNQIDLEAQDADVAGVAPLGDDEAAVPIVVQPPELAPGHELPDANAQPIDQQPNQIDLEAQDADVAGGAPLGDDDAAVPVIAQQPPEMALGLELPVNPIDPHLQPYDHFGFDDDDAMVPANRVARHDIDAEVDEVDLDLEQFVRPAEEMDVDPRQDIAVNNAEQNANRILDDGPQLQIPIVPHSDDEEMAIPSPSGTQNGKRKRGRPSNKMVTGDSEVAPKVPRKTKKPVPVVGKDIIPNEHPQKVCCALSRNDLRIVNRRGRPARISFPRKQEICAICFEEKEGVPGRYCEGNTIGGHRCTRFFHIACAERHQPAGLLVDYAEQPENQGKFLCSLHRCFACDGEHMKQRAYDEFREGEILECLHCESSFHEKCLPAGSRKVTVQVKVWKKWEEVPMIECPAHYKAPRVRKHTKVCGKCGGGANLVECLKCPQSFHQECRDVQTVDGEPVEDDLCNHCAQRAVIRLNSFVLLLSENPRAMIGIVRGWEVVHLPTNQELGMVPFQRLPTKNMQGTILLVSLETVCKMEEVFLGEAQDDNEEKVWRQKLNQYETKSANRFEHLLLPQKMSMKKLKFFTEDIQLPRRTRLLRDPDQLCTCEVVNVITEETCTIANNCEFANDKYECPPKCGKGCKNRKLSEKISGPEMEVVEFAGKGWGVRAMEDIPIETFLGEYLGEVIDAKEELRRKEMKRLSKDLEAKEYFAKLSKGIFIDSAADGNMPRYFNHSCNGNAMMESWWILNRRKEWEQHLAFRSRKMIRKGEEITFNYLEPNFKCVCGSVNCRSG